MADALRGTAAASMSGMSREACDRRVVLRVSIRTWAGGQRDRLRDVGTGGLDRLGRRRDRDGARASGRSSAATSSTRPGPTATATASSLLGRALAQPSRERALRRHQGPAQELQVALPPRLHARRVLPARPHPRVHREEPGEPRPSARSTCSSFTSGKTPGPTTSAGSAPSTI